jgi:hypothetical protein
VPANSAAAYRRPGLRQARPSHIRIILPLSSSALPHELWPEHQPRGDDVAGVAPLPVLRSSTSEGATGVVAGKMAAGCQSAAAAVRAAEVQAAAAARPRGRRRRAPAHRQPACDSVLAVGRPSLGLEACCRFLLSKCERCRAMGQPGRVPGVPPVRGFSGLRATLGLVRALDELGFVGARPIHRCGISRFGDGHLVAVTPIAFGSDSSPPRGNSRLPSVCRGSWCILGHGRPLIPCRPANSPGGPSFYSLRPAQPRAATLARPPRRAAARQPPANGGARLGRVRPRP